MPPSPRRHAGGLSPRQRRLLQASARASSSTTTPHKASMSSNDYAVAQQQEVTSSPSFPSTPVSKKDETHNYLNVSLSPIYDCNVETPVKGNNYYPAHRQCSGASDQTTPTDNISRRVRQLRLNYDCNKSSDEIIPQQRANYSNSNEQLDDSGGEFINWRSGFTNERSSAVTSHGDIQQRWTHNQQLHFRGDNNEKNNNHQVATNSRLLNLNNDRNGGREQTSSSVSNTQPTTKHEEDELKYYRITFKGVVSLLSQLDGNSDDLDDDGKQRSGAHVSYGEIVATSFPEITIPIDNNNSSGNVDGDSITMIRAIRVDSIVTGGYATDASLEMASKSKSSLSLSFNRVNENGHYHLGYLLLHNKVGQTIAEPCGEATASSCEHGSFSYRVNASSPVTVLSGPSLDAPPIRCALLPGTIHEVSLRMLIPTSGLHNNDNAADDDTLGDDGDAEFIQFLRLGRRKGWVADRNIDTLDGNSNKLRVSFVMVDVTHEKGLNQTMGSQSVSLSMSFEETSSLTSFALNSTANSSFYSSIQSSSVATPAAVKAQRKRNVRRRAREADFSRPTNIGDSFEEVESSITGGGGTTVISGGTTVISGDGSESSQNRTETYYLCRVIAPQGLKILDAPHYQVSNLIHSQTPTKAPPRSSTSPGFSPFSRTNAMVAENSPTLSGGRKRSTPTVRYLTRGQFFEASQRMESTGTSSLYSKGQGLVKLADGSGWAIIPYEDELVAQFKSFHGSEPDINDLNAARGFEEVGTAIIPTSSKQFHRLTPSKKETPKSLKDVIWFRIVAPNGVKVLLPPKEKKSVSKDGAHTTPQKSADQALKIERSTSSLESEVASVVSNSSFLGAVWSRVSVTPSKQSPPATQAEPKTTPTKQSKITVIPCGTAVPVESWDASESPKSFVRLVSQGWIPRSLGGITYSVETGVPDIRIGSIWFRVKCSSGIDVRHGPSLNAPSISSENGDLFRFECGEYLRASEVVTFFDKQRERSFPVKECYAKLYRQNRATNDSNQPLLNRYLSLQSYPGEWVQVFGNGQLILEECSDAPSIERDRNGWRCTAVNEVQVRAGPSFQAGGTAFSIRNGQEFIVVEKVACHGEQITWMRLKNHEGWVPTMRESGEEVVHCYLQPNELNSQRMVRQILNNSSRTVY
ncbi:hypothetical protein ACHAXM_008124 [Skeletonema potamos]|jgi:hypothetical protein